MILPTPHALRVPEILSIIFSFADLSVNAVNARVCKLWHDLALDVLWEEVDDLRRLLSLLGPRKSDVYGPYVRGCFYFFFHRSGAEQPIVQRQWLQAVRETCASCATAQAPRYSSTW